jgi:hypothetical protein
MKAEAFCWRLGSLLNLDRHVHPPEVNLSHATIEQYLQSDVLHDDPEPDLRELYTSPPDAQKFLAEECLRFLQMYNFQTPLLERGTVGENPFKGLHGGLGIPLSSRKYDLVAEMRNRLQPPNGCVGLEYASINWPEHIRRAGYTVEEFRNRVLPILDDWFKAGDARYQSWQEAHAYFCSSSVCQCHKWQEPEMFLKTFQILDLYQRACAEVEPPGGDDREFTTDDFPDTNKNKGKLKCRARYDCSECGRRHSVYAEMPVPEPTTVLEGEGREAPMQSEWTCSACVVAKVPPKERSGKKLGTEPRQEQTRFAQEDIATASRKADEEWGLQTISTF